MRCGGLKSGSCLDEREKVLFMELLLSAKRMVCLGRGLRDLEINITSILEHQRVRTGKGRVGVFS